MERSSLLLVLFLVFLSVFSCELPEDPSALIKINQIQAIGSHNSYKKAMDEAIMAQLMALDSNTALSLDYAHLSLTEQLDLGMRKLEIDIVHDPEGGLYSDPAGLRELEAAGIPYEPIDTAMMNRPGFKVLHVQDIDFRTNCGTLKACLREILSWSNTHPFHVPIAISFNAKTGEIPNRPDFTKPLPFSSMAFDSLDLEIVSVIPRDRIITPDDVRQDFETLEAAVRAHNWPTLERARGKFIFVLDERGEKRDNYVNGHPSLTERIMFANVPPGNPEAGFLIMNNPTRDLDTIRQLVSQGYMIRTRADAGTVEARKGDYSRLEAALKSGAQFISTDYYVPDERFGTGYKVSLPNQVIARCNPVIGPDICNNMSLE